MEISFGNKGIYHYMDAKLGMLQELEQEGHMYQVQMLVENQLPYILSSSMLCTDGEVWLTHNTKQCYSLQAMLQQKNMDGRMLHTILDQIVSCSKSMELYLLDASDLVLQTEYMFFDSNTEEIRLLCVPGHQMLLKEQLREFLEYLMPRFDHGDRDGERFLYECHTILSNEWQDFSEFISCLGTYTKSEKRKQNIRQQDCEYIQIDETDLLKEETSEIVEEKESGREFVFSRKFFLFVLAGGAALALIIKYLFFDGTMGTAIFGVVWLLSLLILLILTIREKEDDTEEADEAMASYRKSAEKEPVRSTPEYESWDMAATSAASSVEKRASPSSYTKLVPLTNRALEPLQILSSMPVLTVGREKESDYRIATTQISRVHAKLFNRPDGLYIEDVNSTNGTFINTKRIPAMTEQKLEKGDVVGFANEEFFVS